MKNRERSLAGYQARYQGGLQGGLLGGYLASFKQGQGLACAWLLTHEREKEILTITHSLPHCYEQPTFYPRSTGLLTSKRAEEVAR